MATKKKTAVKRPKRRYEARTRVQLDGWRVVVRMQQAHMDTAALARAMGRSAATVAATLQKVDERTVQLGTAIKLARALGCEVEDLKRGNKDE